MNNNNQKIYKETGFIVLLTLNQCAVFFTRLKWYTTTDQILNGIHTSGMPFNQLPSDQNLRLSKLLEDANKNIQMGLIRIANAYRINIDQASTFKLYYQLRPAEFYLDFVDWRFPNQEIPEILNQAFMERTFEHYEGVMRVMQDLVEVVVTGTVSLSGLPLTYFDSKKSVKDPLEYLHFCHANLFSINELQKLQSQLAARQQVFNRLTVLMG